MKVGGWVMLAMAAWQIIEQFVLSFWLDLGKSPGTTLGGAAFDVTLGLAMLQGSDAARKVVLFLTGAAVLAFAVGILGLSATGFGHLWPILAASLAATLGVFILNWDSEASMPRLATGLILVAAGWIGGLVSSILLVGAPDLETIQTIRKWSSPDRAVKAAELEVRVPPRWVALKPGHPVRPDDSALLTLANTEVICFTQLFREVRSYSVTDDLEFYLDSVAKAKTEGVGELEPEGRTDATIGGATGRRMKVSWKAGKSRLVGFVTAWRDADTFYHLFTFGPVVATKKIQQEVADLERAVAFDAPRAQFLKARAPAIRTACPLLSDRSVLDLSRIIPADSAPETYCRAAYSFALAGEKGLNPDARNRLRSSMRTLFDVIPKAQIGAFGAYVERLREGGAPVPAQDRQMAESIRAGAEKLTPAVQDDVRGAFAMAIEVGMVEASLRR
jgi:hypothetical protein